MTQNDGNAAERLWTADDVAEFLGIHVQTVYSKALAGEIPSLKVGARRRFRRADIERWVEEKAEVA